jgi:16S rRNA (cytosine1402-N4)-methyltransferase
MHKTVLKHEAVDAIVSQLKPITESVDLGLQQASSNGSKPRIIIDGTFGRGGHSQYLLEQLDIWSKQHQSDYLLIALDQDPEAIAYAKSHFHHKNFLMVHDNFSNLNDILASHQIKGVDGILLDLGVSSPQLDQAERGFSFMHDGPLDMRMNPLAGKPASAYLEELTEAELADIFHRYGEERFAKKIAALIKKNIPILQTEKLATLIKQNTPFSPQKHPATRVFQALRIWVNQEMQVLDQFLTQAPFLLNPKGILSLISFHSLEDRLIKQSFKSWSDQAFKHPIFSNQDELGLGKTLGKIKPSDAEISENPRSRSAILRVWQKN